MPDSSQLRAALPGATSRVLAAASRGPIAKAVSKALIAGPSAEHAAARSRQLAKEGFAIAWLPLLPEAPNVAAINDVRDTFLEALDALSQLGVERPDLTIDLAAFGLFDHEIPALDLITALREIGQRARNAGVTLTLTISNPAAIEAVYVLGGELRQDFPEVGLVVPSRLRRGHDDLLGDARPGHRVRLTTSRLDPAIGHTSARESGTAFVDTAKGLLAAGVQVGFETDDVLLLDIAHALVNRFDSAGAEIVAPLGTQTKPKTSELPVRVVVPYGTETSEYISGLVAARPSIALHLPNPMRRRS